jgi:hypothetical protein
VGEDNMKFKSKPESSLKWFVLAIIPIVNLYWVWKVSKIIANTEYERGD